MDLSGFLLARIAEDAEAARAAAEDGGPAVDVDALDAAGPILAAHVERWGPGRVLAECEAKQRIVAEFTDGPDPGDWGDAALRYIALPYADHPDYDPEWKV